MGLLKIVTSWVASRYVSSCPPVFFFRMMQTTIIIRITTTTAPPDALAYITTLDTSSHGGFLHLGGPQLFLLHTRNISENNGFSYLAIISIYYIYDLLQCIYLYTVIGGYKQLNICLLILKRFVGPYHPLDTAGMGIFPSDHRIHWPGSHFYHSYTRNSLMYGNTPWCKT